MGVTYLFYDLETSGLSKPFDQIQQFAGKRLDSHFNELESCFLEVQILPDVIPSPYATITHQVCLDTDENRMTERQAVRKIHALINQPETISIGYNTLGFDDEFLRFTFYRNLFTPYTHQYANGCRRMDVFPMVIFYYLYENHALSWPQLQGRPTLKLEHIVQENGWLLGRAHHAMNDVDATIQLAKHLEVKNPAMWMYLTGYFDKTIDQQRIRSLPHAFESGLEYCVGLMIHAKFGASNLYQSIVLALGTHRDFKNQTIWLRLDRQDIAEMTFEALHQSGQITRKKYAEPGFLLPPTKHYMQYIDVGRMEIFMKNLAYLRAHIEILHAIKIAACTFRYPTIEQIDLDAGLYDAGFLTHEEQGQCSQLHLARAPEHKKILEKIKNLNLYQQVIRMLWRSGEEISIQDQERYIQPLQDKIVQLHQTSGIYDFQGNEKRGIYQMNIEIDELKSQNLNAAQMRALSSLQAWLHRKYKV